MAINMRQLQNAHTTQWVICKKAITTKTPLPYFLTVTEKKNPHLPSTTVLPRILPSATSNLHSILIGRESQEDLVFLCHKTYIIKLILFRSKDNNYKFKRFVWFCNNSCILK